jgi:hypothetical protein
MSTPNRATVDNWVIRPATASSLWITLIGGPDRGIFSSMSFEQLPSTWTDQPLTDPALTANVVDLMVSLGDRNLGTLTIILCEPDDTYRATVIIELPRYPRPDPADLCRTALEPIIPSIQSAPGTSVVLALGRRPSPTDRDEEWASTVTALFEDAGIRLLGFYVATKDGVHQPPVAALT